MCIYSLLLDDRRHVTSTILGFGYQTFGKFMDKPHLVLVFFDFRIESKWKREKEKNWLIIPVLVTEIKSRVSWPTSNIYETKVCGKHKQFCIDEKPLHQLVSFWIKYLWVFIFFVVRLNVCTQCIAWLKIFNRIRKLSHIECLWIKRKNNWVIWCVAGEMRERNWMFTLHRA